MRKVKQSVTSLAGKLIHINRSQFAELNNSLSTRVKSNRNNSTVCFDTLNKIRSFKVARRVGLFLRIASFFFLRKSTRPN